MVLLFVSLCAVCCLASAVILQRATRTVAEVNLRITQLAAGGAAATLAPPAHPYRCPHCDQRFARNSWTPAEGQRGFCGQCMIWVQIAPPVTLPQQREGL